MGLEVKVSLGHVSRYVSFMASLAAMVSFKAP